MKQKPTGMSVLQIGQSYVMLPSEPAGKIFALLQEGVLVDSDYNSGYKYADGAYKKIALEHLSPVVLAKMELGE